MLSQFYKARFEEKDDKWQKLETGQYGELL